MIHPLHFIIGYTVISVAVEDTVRLINAFSARRIVYHDMGEHGGRRYFRLSALTYFKVTVICDRLCIEIKTEKKRGTPFLLGGLFRRWGLLVGGAVAVLCIVLSESVIWDVRITGNERVSDEVIISTLEECGVGVGTPLSRIDVDSVENRFLIASDDISWITVNIIGTLAEVEVREVQRAEVEPDYVCSNLVASENGRIVELQEVRGDVCVQIGEDVSKGQLLVSGVYGSETSPVRFVRSRGKVFAACEREHFIEIPLEYEKKVYTGEKKIKKSIIFFKKEVKFFGNSGNSYASCDTIEVVKYFDFFGLGKLPVGIRTVTYEEYTLQTAVMTEDEAREEALRVLWQRALETTPDAQLLDKSLSEEITDRAYVIRANITTLENIAVEQEVKVEIVN